jgi:hypothetical protein
VTQNALFLSDHLMLSYGSSSQLVPTAKPERVTRFVDEMAGAASFGAGIRMGGVGLDSVTTSGMEPQQREWWKWTTT